MSEMTSYAASLTGSKGKVLEPETITVGPKKLIKLVEEKPTKPEKVEKPSSSKSKKDEPKEVCTPITTKFIFPNVILGQG